MSGCAHAEFDATVRVNKFDDRPGLCNVEVRAVCRACGAALRFLGLPFGLDLGGAAVSVDRKTANLAAVIEGDGPVELEGLTGYTIKRR